MPPREKKQKKEYHFSVEGATEKWYLERLQTLINEKSKIQVIINSDYRKTPVQFVKSLSVITDKTIYHLCDVEENGMFSEEKFKGVLAHLKEASRLKRSVKYRLGYTNIAFELWLILHKMNCNSKYTHYSKYLSLVNKSFGTNFESLTEYKEARNFKQCLEKLTLDDVQSAIQQGKLIEKACIENHQLRQHCGFNYYLDNPSLSIHKIIEQILKDADVLQAPKQSLK